MTGGPLADGVAVRVSALCLDSQGRLSDLLIASAAVRAGLLLDLALAGRVTQTDDAVEIDAEPTGFPPADRLLAAVVAEPGRPLDGWLDERRLGLADLAAANEASGRWVRRRQLLRRDRYVDRAADQTRRDLARSPEVGGVGLTAQDAAVTAVAAAAGLLDRRRGEPDEPSPGLLAATGDVRWLADHVTGHVTAACWRYRAQSMGLRVSGTVGPG
ncbi:GPP34 family phosphoprotein [Trujillonella endophytica]|uniref:GPP34 family phosphoprotein n=1 Tax=Trujillonella endophytica TaxID=673521 RepID=UPI00147F79E5|nr:GPP34 family phosphoprotein [Trujillella endophytica]